MSDDRTVFQPKAQGSLQQGVRLNGMFEIERLIAAGGMGEVYKGVAVASGDAVAIKLVRPEMSADPDVMALFKREAAILHDLLHEAIVRYYVFSLEPELQRYYIAMEFVDGVSLQKRLADGPLTGAEARILLRRIGGALDQAHSRGVVHRDISSDNIILPGGDVRKAKIVDFGIARAARPGEGTIIGGGFAGKYKYVSPEQLGLYGGDVTSRSDIYSFGLVIAEALRGRPIDMEGTQYEVIEKRRTVPDLTGVEPTLQPLLTAMLSPDPKDRPESMAEIASWGETGTTIRPAPAPAASAPVSGRKRGFGFGLAAALAVVILGAGVGAYLWFNPLGPGGGVTSEAKLETPTPSPSLPKLPPPEPTACCAPPTPFVTASSTPTITPTAPPTKVTVDGLLAEMPPKPSRSEATLAAATVGAAYRAPLPPFADPAGKGLILHAAPAPPTGLAFRDLGGGRGEIAGTPSSAGAAAFDIVAVSQGGKSARMTVALTVNAKPPAPEAPPQAPRSVVDLEAATAGASYSSALPPFWTQAPVTLHAGTGLPEGLTFYDLGGGLSQITGEPKKAGKYAFDIVARTAAGATAHMQVRVTVAAAPPLPVATPSPTEAVAATPEPEPSPSASQLAKVETPPPSVTPAAFLRDYPPAPCFVAQARQDDPSGKAIVVIGADTSAFERFDVAFRKAVAAEADLHGLVVRQSQCPAVDFLASASVMGAGAPKILLDRAEIGKGRPLSGTVLGLAGRELLLMVVDDDGEVIRLRSQPAAGGDAATFSAGFTGDASSYGKPQMLIAVASNGLTGAVKIDGGASAELMPKLAAKAREVQAAADVALFKFAP